MKTTASPSPPFTFLFILLLLLIDAANIVSSSSSATTSRSTLDVSIGIGRGGISIGGGGGSGGDSGSSPYLSPPGGGGTPYPSPPGGGGTPYPSPPTGGLQPCDFVNEKQYRAYLVIQRFKRTITCDPYGVTNNWNGPFICNYTGYYCEAPPNAPNEPTIASVDFHGYYLGAPTLVGFLDQLPDIALFHANSNNFSGPIPNLSGLPFLYELDFSNNKHSGPFPYDLLPLKNLLFLDIRFNQFEGSVPPSLFNIYAVALFINNNGFTGPIPVSAGSTPITYIALANNAFDYGPFPTFTAAPQANLSEAFFLNERLTGCLPYDIGLLRQLSVLDAGNNFLTGTIPASYACLDLLEDLNLANNQLYGCVPDELCQLGIHGKLTNLSLSGNYFNALGPSCQTLVKRGILDIRRNCIPWFPDQRSPEECSWFYSHCEKCPVLSYEPCKSPPPAKQLPPSSPPHHP